MVKNWKLNHIWDTLHQHRIIYKETASNSGVDFNEIINSYQQTVLRYTQDHTAQRNGLLLAVIRGRISEGLNLSDSLCRCVIIVGIPHPSLLDPRLKMKQQILDTAFPGKRQGFQWYMQQTWRAINQAIGRIVRHKDDYGCILLIDERFSIQQQCQDISHWIRNSMNDYDHLEKKNKKDYQDVLKSLKKFFIDIHLKFPSHISDNNSTFIDTRLIQNTHCDVTTSQLKQTSIHSNKNVSNVRRNGQFKKVSNWKQIKKIKFEKNNPTLLDFNFSHNSNSICQDTNIFSSNIKIALEAENNSQITNIQYSETSTQGIQNLKCGICAQRMSPENKLMKSKRCSHTACQNCWLTALKKFRCPYCSKIIRPEHLVNFSFAQ